MYNEMAPWPKTRYLPELDSSNWSNGQECTNYLWRPDESQKVRRRLCWRNLGGVLNALATAKSISENLHELETVIIRCSDIPPLQCYILFAQGLPKIRFMYLGIFQLIQKIRKLESKPWRSWSEECLISLNWSWATYEWTESESRGRRGSSPHRARTV